MSLPDGFAALPLTRAIGWTVVHFLWQGTVIAAGCAGLLSILRRRSAAARYAVCGMALALMLLTPLATLATLLAAGGPPARAVVGGPAAGDVAAVLADLVALSGWQRVTPLLPWITLLWLAGFGLFQCRAVVYWTRAQRLKQAHTRGLSPAWQRAVSRLCERVGVRQAVRVVESTAAEVPMLIGWLSPVILIPTSALCGLSREQLVAVLAHELAHVRRHDTLVNLLQATLESLLFFHPAVWWVSDRMRAEREFCCDDVAVEICGDTLCYARALSTLEHLRDAPYPAVASNGGPLMQRITRLVGTRPSAMSGRTPGLTPVLLATSLVVALAAAGLAVAGNVDYVATEPGPEPDAWVSAEPGAEPGADDEPKRLIRQIAKREAELERLQLRLDRQRSAADREREPTEPLTIEREARARDEALVLERYRTAQADLERALSTRRSDPQAAERDAQRLLKGLQAAEREYQQSSQAAQLELERALAVEHGAQAADRAQQDAFRTQAAQLELERSLALRHDSEAARLEYEKSEGAARLHFERALAQGRDAEAARRELRDRERATLRRLQDGLALERDEAAAEGDALETLERALELSRERLDTDAVELREELDRLRILKERAARDGDRDALRSLRESSERARRRLAEEPEPLRRDSYFSDGNRGDTTPDQLRRELAERKAAIEKLHRELALQRSRLEATISDLERLEAREAEEDHDD